jgi:ribosome-associated protein
MGYLCGREMKSYRMNQTKELVEAVVKGMQEKKGKRITMVDLTQLSGAICEYMIICEGNSLTQVSSLSDSVWEAVRSDTDERLLSMDGDRQSSWIGMDYGSVLVHIFLPEQRSFYDLEHLWADSNVTEIPDPQ